MSQWRPGASRAALEARAALFAQLRRFFAERELLEVDTPLLARFAVTDPSIEPLPVNASQASPEPLYLQSSPEYAMKRLLCAGVGPIYQLGKAFRDGEFGSRHNPEFTLLEWYQPGFDLQAMMREVGSLVSEVLGRTDLGQISYQELFVTELSVDPWESSAGQLEALARERLGLGELELDRDGWLDLLMSHCIEPSLKDRGPLFVFDYPPTQAALARCVQRGQRSVAERFELYVDGIELANGYRELRDADELERRAETDNRRRRDTGQQARVLDPMLLAAMRTGLPDCSGVALGVDRLLMLSLGAAQLSDVMPFDWSRC
ncbi:MAG: EF-P lysine aminoacylase EpmA [Congregibacter sp.]